MGLDLRDHDGNSALGHLDLRSGKLLGLIHEHVRRMRLHLQEQDEQAEHATDDHVVETVHDHLHRRRHEGYERIEQQTREPRVAQLTPIPHGYRRIYGIDADGVSECSPIPIGALVQVALIDIEKRA